MLDKQCCEVNIIVTYGLWLIAMFASISCENIPPKCWRNDNGKTGFLNHVFNLYFLLPWILNKSKLNSYIKHTEHNFFLRNIAYRPLHLIFETFI